MSAPSAYEIRRILKIYDDSAIAPVGRAIQMLSQVTKAISDDPKKHDLTSEEEEVWMEAGGSSYGINQEFPSLVGKRWMETLEKPGVAKAAGMDKDEWAALLKSLTAAEEKLNASELSLEVMEELTELIEKIREEAPEPEDSDDDDDDSDDE